MVRSYRCELLEPRALGANKVQHHLRRGSEGLLLPVDLLLPRESLVH